jgi:hypothetical protein
MKHVIHDWNDEDALKILRICRRAMDPGGMLLLIEWVLKPSNEVDIGKLLDLNMLVNLGGLNRTEPEFQSLLRQAGFSLTRIIPAVLHGLSRALHHSRHLLERYGSCRKSDFSGVATWNFRVPSLLA